MKKLIFALTFILGLTALTYAQIDEEGGQFFGGQRAVAFNQYNFGTITAPVSHEFIIKNTTPNPMIISEIDVPDGVTITIVGKVIQPRQSGKIIVTIDPKNIHKKGTFKAPMKVITVQNLNNGQVLKTISVYMLSGVVK